MPSWAELLRASFVGLEVSDHQIAALEHFLDRLYEANQSANLTRVPREQAWVRHLLDSVLWQDLIPVGSSVLDIGTGPGLPAWPLACVRPDLRVTGLDSNLKMLGFLRSVPLPNLKVLEGRAEEWRGKQFDVVTGRALAPLAIQLELSARPCRAGGLVIPMRTEKDLPEIERLSSVLGLDLERIERRTLPGLTSETPRVFPVYRKAGKTPPGFPRKWSEIKKRPL